MDFDRPGDPSNIPLALVELTEQPGGSLITPHAESGTIPSSSTHAQKPGDPSTSLASTELIRLSSPSRIPPVLSNIGSTFVGVGSLGVKGISAIGKAAQKGVDRYLMSKRLSDAEMEMPHVDPFTNMDKLYDNLLELSR